MQTFQNGLEAHCTRWAALSFMAKAEIHEATDAGEKYRKCQMNFRNDHGNNLLFFELVDSKKVKSMLLMANEDAEAVVEDDKPAGETPDADEAKDPTCKMNTRARPSTASSTVPPAATNPVSKRKGPPNGSNTGTAPSNGRNTGTAMSMPVKRRRQSVKTPVT